MSTITKSEILATLPRRNRAVSQKEMSILLKKNGVNIADSTSTNRILGRAVQYPLVFEPPVAMPRVEPLLRSVGKYSFAGSGSVFERVAGIGRYCSLASDIIMGRAFHPTTFLSSCKVFYAGAGSTLNGAEFEEFSTAAREARLRARQQWIKIEAARHPEIKVGHDVWIGDRVIVMQGVSIGHGAVVAAGSVVSKDVPPYAIVGGVPARVIKYRFTERQIERLLSLQWWSMPLLSMKKVPFHDIDAAIDMLENMRATEDLSTSHVEIRLESDAEGVTVTRNEVVDDGVPLAAPTELELADMSDEFDEEPTMPPVEVN
jgi:acetyltransferase-like isoleucine patch superfamily enzyme